MGTPIRYTTKFSGRLGGTWRTANAVYGLLGGSWRYCRYIYVKTSGSWVGVYSTPDVTVSGGGGNTGSGASPSGSTSVGASASLGGTHSGNISYSWTRLSGDSSITPNNSASSSPTFSRSFTGVPNGSNSGGVSADWRCTVTDTLTGAQVVADLTIGPLSWTNTIPAFSGQTDKFTSSGSVSRPTGANTVQIWAIGCGGQGGSGQNFGEYGYGGGGGGAGGRMIWSGAAASSYSFTVGGLASPAYVNSVGTANAGGNGGSADGSAGGPGSGGSASSGNVANDTGSSGSSGDSGGNSVPGGSGWTGPDGSTYGTGGDGGSMFGGGSFPAGGAVYFVWSP